ncbi:MAG: hypothetical protein J5I98_17720 [Phaeodactylibacter sp.]|nr:hypothetical protein [Phaeodactylibacter sp.]
MAIPIRTAIALLFLLSLLYLSIHIGIQSTPPPVFFSFDRIEADGSVVQFGFEDLKVIIEGMLERVRSGKSISHRDEKMLKSMFGGGAFEAKMSDFGFSRRHFSAP